MPATDTFSKAETSSSSAATTTSTTSVEDEGAACSSGGGGAAGNSKRGFVYVQQPHYSVFDVPAAENLGKRRRRVHNYSMLAKGPSLKGKDILLAEGDEIDGESAANSSRSTSPASPAPSNSSSAQLFSSSTSMMTSTNHSSTRFGNSSDGDKSNSTSSTGFARRRRFLTSPIKTSDKTIIFSSNKVSNSKAEESCNNTSSKNNGSDNRSIFKKSECTNNSRQNSAAVSASVVPPAKAVASNLAVPTKCRDSSSNSNSVKLANDGEVATTVSRASKSNRNVVKSNAASNSRTTINNVVNVTATNNSDLTSPLLKPTTDSTATTPLPASNEITEEIPAKRLRRPTFKRFSEEEGYVDILSSRRNRRENARRSTPINNVKASSKSSSYRSTSRSSLSKAQHEPSPPPPLIEAPLFEDTPQSQLSAKDDLNRLPKLKKSTSCAAVSIQLPVGSNSKAKLTPVLPSSTSGRRKANNHPVIYNALEESEEEELLDVDEYTDISCEIPNLSPRKGIAVTPTRSPVKSFSATNKNLTQKHRDVDSAFLEETAGSNSLLLPNQIEGTVTEDSVTNSRELRRRKCASRRWTMPSRSTIDSSKSLPSVVLDRLPISQVQIRVKKCDNNPAPTSVAQKSPLVDINDQSLAHSPTDLLDKTAESLMDEESSDWKHPRRKRWGENKHRWTKPRNKTGLLTGIRQGIKTNESLSLQLLKRSKLQRRYEKRGRPKVALLTGITKKKLKRIQDSVQKRKLTKKPIIAYTKFKDVRVDIINCICGRTDEFGLMVQCEVCLCWQHGMCFDILDGSMIPGFYVCQSCKSPKNVRPRSLIEGIRQKTYKKGILPRYPFAPQPSEKDQKLVHSTYELCKLIDSVEDIIRQNRIKEQIVLAEPENPKLYQWSTPRESPKDRVQKWYFNKYFLSVLRRLLLRNRKQPDYVEKLKNIVLFREKLKTYTQAFDEAKAAIARKIGSRGLILVEKLSEHQKKLDKINKLKAECTEEIVKQNVEDIKHEEPGQVSELLPPPPPKMEPETKASDGPASSGTSSVSGAIPDKHKCAAWKLRLDKIIDCIEDLYQEWDTSSDHDDEVAGGKGNGEFSKKVVQFNDVEPLPKNSPIIQDWKEVNESKNKIKSHPDNTQVSTASTGMKLKESSQRKRPRQIKEEVLEPTPKKKSTAAVEDYVRIRLVEDQKLKSKTQIHMIDEGSLSGASTISGVDSQGGEDYWYNPIRDLNPEYESLKRFLLKDPLLDDDRSGDPTWRPRVEDISEDDWKADMDSPLDFSDESESSEAEDSDSESTTEVDVEDSMDPSLAVDVVGDVPQTETITVAQTNKQTEVGGTINGTGTNDEDWKNRLLSEKLNDSTEDDEDPDWQMEISEPEINSSTRNKTSDIGTSHYASSCSINGMKPRKLVGSPSGVLLVTSDTEAKVGDKVTVCINVSGGEEVLGTGLVVGGNKGNNFIRLLHKADLRIELPEPNGTTTDTPSATIPLCRSCKESLGHKWTWNQLNNAKGLEVVCEDTLRSFIEELNLYQELGISWSSLNVQIQLPTKSRNSAYFKQFSTPFSFQSTSIQSKCDDYRMKYSKENTPLGLNISSLLPDFNSSQESHQPASAEEESVLSLLSLSKTPVQFNGENVSELSIESLRKLTDRLQQNGPLTEDLAKAVGEPLVNGKIGLQNSNAFPSNSTALGPTTTAPPDICLRCSLRGKTRKTLTILSTLDSNLAKTMSEIEIVHLYNKIKEIITDTRAVLHVIKKALLNRIWLTVEQVDAERAAVASGKTISPSIIQKKLALRRPEKHLVQQKSEYVDALLPYATYFISRFTKRDELNNAKRTWVEEMVKNYIRSKRVLKRMFDAANEDERVAKEAKFYTALDNLRKSFDIVLTKKDIKLRRQNQVSQSSLESPTSATLASSNGPTSLDDSITEDAQITKELDASVIEVDVEKLSKPNENGTTAEEDTSIKSNALEPDSAVQISDPVTKESNGSSENPSETELEIIARLTRYPIQMEDVNALLKITKLDLDLKTDCGVPGMPLDANKIEECTKSLGDAVSSELKKIDTVENVSTTSTNGIDAMEVDDIKLLEANLALKTTDNLEIGGDFDLINTIGTLGSSVDLKEQEDSDLLLNVFDDPVFSEPQEPTPCCSKSLVQPKDNNPQPVSTGPVLAKLTPEICKGYLLDDIKAHQLVIDTQLERVEAEIMELERRHGAGLREKDDSSLFEMLYANMQTMIHNYEVLSKIAERQVGENNPVDKDDEDLQEPTNQHEAPSPTQDEAVIDSSSESESSTESEEELLDIPY